VTPFLAPHFPGNQYGVPRLRGNQYGVPRLRVSPDYGCFDLTRGRLMGDTFSGPAFPRKSVWCPPITPIAQTGVRTRESSNPTASRPGVGPTFAPEGRRQVVTGAAQRNPWTRSLTHTFRPEGAAESNKGDQESVMSPYPPASYRQEARDVKKIVTVLALRKLGKGG